MQFPGQPHEMVFVYTADGSDLILDHLLRAGQSAPDEGRSEIPANEIVWRLASGADLDPKKDKHMREATLTVVDGDHIEVDGIDLENGAPAKKCVAD
jgi:hypothetical protein